MIRFITPFILLGIAVASFFVLANPLYKDISVLRIEASSYDEALANSKALENERDKLTAKYNEIDPNNLIKIKKLLPGNIDNIRLILEIEQIAAPYNMILKDVKYSTVKEDENGAAEGSDTVLGATVLTQASQDYGIWDLEFSTAGDYNNFLSFLRDLESNLRIVDISSITFSSDVGAKLNQSLPDIYTYSFAIKTYWLKN